MTQTGGQAGSVVRQKSVCCRFNSTRAADNAPPLFCGLKLSVSVCVRVCFRIKPACRQKPRWRDGRWQVLPVTGQQVPRRHCASRHDCACNSHTTWPYSPLPAGPSDTLKWADVSCNPLVQLEWTLADFGELLWIVHKLSPYHRPSFVVWISARKCYQLPSVFFTVPKTEQITSQIRWSSLKRYMRAT